MLCLFQVQSLYSSGPVVRVVEEPCWVYIYKAMADFEEHLQVGLSSSLFKVCLHQICEHGGSSACDMSM